MSIKRKRKTKFLRRLYIWMTTPGAKDMELAAWWRGVGDRRESKRQMERYIKEFEQGVL